MCLVCLVLFSVTGFTLNHATDITATPRVTTREGVLPATLRAAITEPAEGSDRMIPVTVRRWLSTHWSLDVGAKSAEWSTDEIYLTLPRAGGDAWLSIDRASGETIYEMTDRGWIAWLNDLHKGRNTGPVWRWFIDIFALAALVFAGTGLFLLFLHAKHRPATWPVTAAGLVLPWLLVILFVH